MVKRLFLNKKMYMMKKEYIKPKLKVMVVENQDLMGLGAHSTSECLSRENDEDFSVWDENDRDWDYSDSDDSND